jgi:hypothetical protein
MGSTTGLRNLDEVEDRDAVYCYLYYIDIQRGIKVNSIVMAGRGTRDILSHGGVNSHGLFRTKPARRQTTGVARRFPRSCLTMADSFPPTIAPQTDSSGNAPEAAQQAPDAAEPVPITEQEVGEYREQDRYLPVSRLHT